jgi:predicted AAA+ superfamily ATPase
MIGRIVNPLISNSFFLFGARGTGKTSLLRELFKNKRTLWIDLLMPSQEETYQLRPEALAEAVDALSPRPEWVVIDEVQRAPKLLDVVHSLIEADWNRKRELKFALPSIWYTPTF